MESFQHKPPVSLKIQITQFYQGCLAKDRLLESDYLFPRSVEYFNCFCSNFCVLLTLLQLAWGTKYKYFFTCTMPASAARDALKSCETGMGEIFKKIYRTRNTKYFDKILSVRL